MQTTSYSNEQKFNLHFFSEYINEKKIDESLTSLDKIDNLLVLRIINKLAGYIVGGYHIQFENPKIQEEFEKWNRYDLREKLHLAVRESMVDKRGAVVFFTGGSLSNDGNLKDPITEIKKINAFRAGYVSIKKPNYKEAFLDKYHSEDVVATLENGRDKREVIINPSRYGRINLFDHEQHSFAQRITPLCDVIKSMIERCDHMITIEGGFVFEREPTMGQRGPYRKDPDKVTEAEKSATKMELKQFLLDIVNKFRSGKIAYIPSGAKLSNFSNVTSLDKILPVMKDTLSAYVGIPKSILFGEEKSGLNTGAGKEKDHDNFMRDVQGWQNSQIKPIIKKFVSVFLKGKEEQYEIKFDMPETLNEKEKAEANKLHNDGLVALANVGAIDDEEVKKNMRGVKVDD